MQTVILCGGEGTRLREYTHETPKVLIKIGRYPILWHIMKIYASYGFKEFILCLGYKGDMIKDFFLNYQVASRDFTLEMNSEKSVEYHEEEDIDWKITFVNTGEKTPTGGRIQQIKEYIKGDSFFVTYGDGLANINLIKLLEFHQEKQKTATVTAINPTLPFGLLKISENNEVDRFEEKPTLNQWVNGGFFVFTKKVFEFLESEDALEKQPLERLASQKDIVAYKHQGFWQSMDTFKDHIALNKLGKSKPAPWEITEV